MTLTNVMGSLRSSICGLTKLVFILALVINGLDHVNAQSRFTTLSGQVLEQNINGSFSVVTPQLVAIDTVDAIMLNDSSYTDLGMKMLVLDQNPIALPMENDQELSGYEEEIIGQLVKKAKAKEVELWILSYKITKEIDANEVSLSLANNDGNQKLGKETQTKLDDLKQKLKSNKKNYERTSKQIVEANLLSKSSPKSRTSNIKKLAVELDVPVDARRLTPMKSMINKQKKLEELGKYNCTISYYNSESKAFKTTLEPFFSYTPEKLKSHLKTNDILIARIGLGKVKKKFTMNLQLSLQNKEVAKSYGAIIPGNQVIISFTNGLKVAAVCQAASSAVIEPYTARSIYTVEYGLPSDDMKRIKKFPIDKITLQFTSGYETYTIYEVDLLMNQASCLDKL